jgi:hypothetical protein
MILVRVSDGEISVAGEKAACDFQQDRLHV